jgi:hypothetical protein
MKRTPLKRTAFVRKPPEDHHLIKWPARRKPKPAAVRTYWDKVAALGCIVSSTTEDVTIHHVHGGSMRGVIPRGRGVKHDWMVIPLASKYHTGQFGIDGSMGVMAWEKKYGPQLGFLLEVMRQTGVDPFKASGMPWPETVDKPAKE